ncbi:MAG: hypothetical protein KDH96_04335 [Candidatus Riesia sp.]|nr:hypothetical protein [Candidatus Riesia sp.]
MAKIFCEPNEIRKNWQFIKELEPSNKTRRILALCLLCNREYNISLGSFRSKYNSFCCKSCCKVNKINPININDVFGRLTVIDSYLKDSKTYFVCQCECGNITNSIGFTLKNGTAKSCGCLSAENSSARWKNRTGDKNHMWRGGIAKYDSDRAKVRLQINPLIYSRDNKQCQVCNNKTCNFNVHHIYDFANYIELRELECNCILLCENCHREFHKVYLPYETNTLQNLESFFNFKYKYREELLKNYSEYYGI